MAGINASPLFANAATNALDDFNTNTVAAGGVDADVVCAETKRARTCFVAVEHGYASAGGVPLATAAEAGRAEMRAVEATAQAAGAAVAPPWFAAWAANQFATLAALQAQLHNVTVSRRNEQAFAWPNSTEIMKPAKTVPGFGQVPLPAMVPPRGIPAAIAAVLAAPPPPPGILAVPPQVFPFLAMSHQVPLTQAEIGYLAMFYNNSFEIVVGDDHAAQVLKFKRFLMGLSSN